MSEDENNNSNGTQKSTIKNESNIKKPLNIIFYCEQCNRIPLIIPSNINYKMIKYCNIQKKAEIISPSDLLNMINIKNSKRRDPSKDILNIIDTKINKNEFLCSLHGKRFINYCDDCSMDICYNCSKEHLNHKLIYFSKFLPTKRDIRDANKILSEMKSELKRFIQNTKEIIKNCENLINLKEKVLNALNSIDLEKLNYYSIMNYKNILKIKIQLNEKLYYIINPLSKLNSNLLDSIKYNFEKQIKAFPSKENPGNILSEKMQIFQKDNNMKNKPNYLNNNNIKINNIENLYHKYLDILKKTFEVDNEENKSNSNDTELKFKTNKISEKSPECNEQLINEDNMNDFLNLEIKNDVSIPIKNFYKVKKIKTKKLEEESDDSINCVKEINLSEHSEVIPEINKFPRIFENDKSNIMDNKETNDIINLISSQIKKKIKKLYLCYRATDHGDKAENFHKRCDYINNIIILIQTQQNKKFGGFSAESWDNNDKQTFKKDNQAFIFSLDDLKAYNIKEPERALLCDKKYGPIFGNREILIPDNFFKSPSSCLEKDISYELNGNSFGLNGEKEFYVKEMEAYKVDFE